MFYVVNVFSGEGEERKLIRHVEILCSDGESIVTVDERHGATREENSQADTVYCPGCGKNI
ncbi:MAG: hypothetical protein WC794_03180 [Candidatus Doudnabacteria bacterium]|jgi:hypothetical protein